MTAVLKKTFDKHAFPQGFTVSRDHRGLHQYQVNLEVFVQQATSVQKAVLSPHPAQLAPSEMRPEEKAKTTASLAFLVIT